MRASQDTGEIQKWGNAAPASEGELTEYRRRKLELGELIRSAMKLSAERRQAPTEAGGRKLLARLAEDHFQLAVVGQFSRGKSTLMNAVLGAPYLPTGALPMTSVVTRVRYGSRPRVTAHRRDEGRIPIETSLGELVRFVAQASSEREEMQVASVDVAVPAEILRLGFYFVDTPGIGSAIAANSAITKRFLPEADAVVFVTSFDAPLAEHELEFLRDVKRHVGRLFFVVNKLDLVSAREAEEISRFMCDRLSLGSDPGEPRIFAISAQRALQARLQGDADGLDASGLPEFERSLVHFLTAEKLVSFLATMCRRADRLLARQRLDLELGRANSVQDPHEREKLVSNFERRIDGVLGEQRRIAERLRDRSTAHLSAMLSERTSSWIQELCETARHQVDERWPQPPVGRGVEPWLRAVASQLDATAPTLFADWLKRRRVETRSLLLEAASDELGALYSARASLDCIGAEIFRGLAHDVEPELGWSPTDLPELAVSEVRLSIPIDAPRRPLRRPRSEADARGRLLQGIDSAAAAFCGSTRTALIQAVERWVDDVVLRIEKETRSVADRILESVHNPGTDGQLALQNSLEQRLAAFQEDLSAWQPAAGVLIVEPVHAKPRSAAERPGPCVICSRVADVPFRYLAHAQWELFRRDDYREQHVRHGGFCAMHTWQYAEIASDIGIATTYAPLAESAAELITSSAVHADEGVALRNALSTLMAYPERCLVCKALADAEHDAIRDLLGVLSQRTDGEPPPPVCLPHVAAVLAAEPDPEHTVWLAESLASRLVRLSEDMRAYSLKRASLRGHLLSEEEDAAPRQGISHFAGRRELIRPWRLTDEIG